jgi:ATP-dependent DNA helicase RecQ
MHCWLARSRASGVESAAATRVAVMARKILQRGSSPPVHPESERHLLERIGLGDDIVDAALPGDLACRFRRPPRLDVLGALGLEAPDFSPDPDLALDERSPYEASFLSEWVPGRLGPTAGRWMIPQASLDALAAAAGAPAEGARRVDFVASPPWLEPFVVELGPHGDDVAPVDAGRDSELAQAGIDVLRVENLKELRSLDGPQLDAVARRWEVPSARSDEQSIDLVYGPPQLHRLVLGIVEALESGFLAGSTWTIAVEDPLELAVDLVRPYLDLLGAIDALWRGDAVADHIVITHSGGTIAYRRTNGRFLRANDAPGDAQEPDVVIQLEIDRSPSDALHAAGATPTIVIRSAVLPVEQRSTVEEGPERRTIEIATNEQREALRVLLQTAFAKDDFREGQLEALIEVLGGRDCTVLLPTGAGKSLIYQLAGLCLPGRTLVVDPIIALMEDQVFGLAQHGIDRVAEISSSRVREGRGDELLRQVAGGDALFVFVAPERLQMSAFRGALRELASVTPVNLAVVDEAHYVSEWGHQFRTSYLNLGATLRDCCRDAIGEPPSILALTGTASRAVLRNVLFELEMKQQTGYSIVKPATFDRPELQFEIVRTRPGQSEASLRGYVNSLPAKFRSSHGEFFSANGVDTYSGIVFCPHVNGDYGVFDVSSRLADVIGHRPSFYAGARPRGVGGNWDFLKRSNAQAFKENRAPVLVATNAFGVGIDKPNIRWVLHYGVPGSIEAYYQEVGRSGRDGNPARCGLIFSEFDEGRDRRLLDEDLALEMARADHSSVGRSDSDDVTRALFFYFSTFKPVDEMLDAIDDVVDAIEPLDNARTVALPFRNQDDQEKAIHRLVLLGVVRDYQCEWGSQRFVLHVARSTQDTVVDHLISYVGRNQPGRVDQIAATLRSQQWAKLRDAIRGCAEELITFIYDTIARSRRRSLREIWLLAREARGDEEVRERILDYLTEGDLAPMLERLAERSPFTFDDWIEPYRLILAADDVREWRGNTARLLTSYPLHPGLLVGRGLAELLDPDGSLDEFGSSLDAALEAAMDQYNLQADQIVTVIDVLWELASTRRPAGLSLIYEASRRHAIPSQATRAASRGALLGEYADRALDIVVLADYLDRELAQATATAEIYEGRL